MLQGSFRTPLHPTAGIHQLGDSGASLGPCCKAAAVARRGSPLTQRLRKLPAQSGNENRLFLHLYEIIAVKYSSKTIKSWALKERPREKLSQNGARACSDAELLALLLGSGSRGQNVVQLARSILQSVNGNLAELSRLNLADFTRFKGVGPAKAITLSAAMELARRREIATFAVKPQIKSSTDVVKVVGPILRDLHREEFWVLFLNQANRVVAQECISQGGISGTVVDARIIFKKAIQHNVSAIILAHNHPSGNNKPSDADINITQKAIKGGKLLDIRILDHVIIAGDHYVSFADEGYI
ncbi:MAG: DNA repair protein RadC [Bacteroidetes bacterium]|nr:DNA repair protein RadC [Bacteroidota bacterium]